MLKSTRQRHAKSMFDQLESMKETITVLEAAVAAYRDDGDVIPSENIESLCSLVTVLAYQCGQANEVREIQADKD